MTKSNNKLLIKAFFALSLLSIGQILISAQADGDYDYREAEPKEVDIIVDYTEASGARIINDREQSRKDHDYDYMVLSGSGATFDPTVTTMPEIIFEPTEASGIAITTKPTKAGDDSDYTEASGFGSNTETIVAGVIDDHTVASEYGLSDYPTEGSVYWDTKDDMVDYSASNTHDQKLYQTSEIIDDHTGEHGDTDLDEPNLRSANKLDVIIDDHTERIDFWENNDVLDESDLSDTTTNNPYELWVTDEDQPEADEILTVADYTKTRGSDYQANAL